MKALALVAFAFVACAGRVESDDPEPPVPCVYDVPGEDEGDCPADQRCVVFEDGNFCADYSCPDGEEFCPGEQDS